MWDAQSRSISRMVALNAPAVKSSSAPTHHWPESVESALVMLPAVRCCVRALAESAWEPIPSDIRLRARCYVAAPRLTRLAESFVTKTRARRQSMPRSIWRHYDRSPSAGREVLHESAAQGDRRLPAAPSRSWLQTRDR